MKHLDNIATDGTAVPYGIYTDPEVFRREQEAIFQGPTWNFVGLSSEIPAVHDFKRSFISTTPVVMTRLPDQTIAVWVNRCAHRGAIVCRAMRGNASDHSCVYHQWNYSADGALTGVPFRRGHKGNAGMPGSFEMGHNGLKRLRVEDYRGLVFATFDHDLPDVASWVGPTMTGYLDRVLKAPLVYLGCTRQVSTSNWKLYFENVKDPYHASLLHLFHTTFNIFRVGMAAHCTSDVADHRDGLNSIIFVSQNQDNDDASSYSSQAIRSYDEGFVLEDPSVLDLVDEFDVRATNHIQCVFPQLVLQQIHNSLVARQVIAHNENEFELVFHFFGFADDTPEMRALRIKQANLVGAAGYISMEDTEATELVRAGTQSSPERHSTVLMALDQRQESRSTITEQVIRDFWQGYRSLMVSPERDLSL
jgi:anthranilate 1,2-dioxygenase large subunit